MIFSDKLAYMARLLSSYREFYTGQETLSNPPLHVYLEITSACNLRCKMCPVGHSRDTLRKPAFMSRAMVGNVLAQAKGKVREFSLHVLGEPLLHPEFCSIIEDMHENGFRVRLYTNATLLTEEAASRILDAKLDAISFSVDGYTPEEYAGIRVGGDFETALGNIERFMAMKRERRAGLPKTVFQIIELEKAPEVDEAIRDAHLKRVRSMGFDHLRVIPPNSLAGPAAKTLSNYKKKRGGYFQCNQLWSSMAILANGDYVPCCLDTVPAMRLGNIESDKLMDVWNGPGMRELRRKLAAGELKDLPLCRDCSEPWLPTFLGVPLSKFKETAKRLLAL